MAASPSEDIGSVKDQVTLVLADKELVIAESYEVRQGYFEQPSSFSITTGSGDSALALLRSNGPNSPFELRIGGVPQFVGVTDGFDANGNGSATTITIRGRDLMAALFDTRMLSDQSFSEASYPALAQKILDMALPDRSFALRYADNDVANNRKKKSGNAPIVVTGVPPYLAELFSAIATAKPQIQAKAGEPLFHFLKKELDRTGLFLYCGVNGDFILAAPNPNQSPIYRIVRQRGATRNLVNVEDYHFHVSTVGRATNYIVLGRGGGAPVTGAPALPPELAALSSVGARGGIKGIFVDAEMAALGIKTNWVHKDKHCTNSKQAEYLARKKCANAARHGFDLSYKVTGHTTPLLAGGSQRGIWTVDTMVDVQDDELGLRESMWVESVSMRRAMSGGTTTEIKLMRATHLVFGGTDD